MFGPDRIIGIFIFSTGLIMFLYAWRWGEKLNRDFGSNATQEKLQKIVLIIGMVAIAYGFFILYNTLDRFKIV